MENATIIRLEPNGPGVSNNLKVASFEEAFLGENSSMEGENSSELRGRGRARRQKRKLKKIASRGERKQARQTIRAQQQEARQVRKDTRKTRRVARKQMGDEPETEMDQQTAMETGQSEEQNTNMEPQNTGDGNGQGEYQTTQNSDVPQDQGWGSSGGANQGGGSGQGQGGGYDQSQEEWGGGAPQDQEGWGEDQQTEQTGGEDQGSTEGGDDAISEDESGFSGEATDGKMVIHPKIKENARKIEWHKHQISELQAQAHRIRLALQNALQGPRKNKLDNDLNVCNDRIADHQKRMADLEGRFSAFSNAGGGRNSITRGKQIAVAKRMARNERMQHNAQKVKEGAKFIAKRTPVGMAYGKIKMRRTPVEADLKPQFEDERIEVPAESNENFHGVDGSKKKINWAYVGIGVGLGILAIYGITKLSKKK